MELLSSHGLLIFFLMKAIFKLSKASYCFRMLFLLLSGTNHKIWKCMYVFECMFMKLGVCYSHPETCLWLFIYVLLVLRLRTSIKF